MTEIIVYRNPLEAMLWNNMMSGDGILIMLFVIFGGIIYVASHVAVNAILTNIFRVHWKKRQTISLWVSGIIVALYALYGISYFV